MRKFIIFTFAAALMGLPLTAHADDGTLANDANGYYDFIPADQLDSSFARDAQTDSVTPDLAPRPGGSGGGPGGGGHGGGGAPGGGHGGGGFPGGPGGGGGHGGPGNGGPHPGPGAPGGGGFPGGPGGGGGHGGPGNGGPHPGPGGPGGGGGFPGGPHPGPGHGGGGGGFPIPIPIPIPVPAHNWACYSRDRGGRQYDGYSYDQLTARQNAMNACEQDSNSGHCRLIGCRRY